MIVLSKRIRKSDSRKIVRARTISRIIKEKEIRHIWWIVIRPNVSIYRFFKDGLYAGISDEDESANYASNELFYIPIFSYRNIVFNAEIDKFNIYRSSFTKTFILDTHIYKSDPSRVIYSGIEINPNEVI